jgi:hypothetical protein
MKIPTSFRLGRKKWRVTTPHRLPYFRKGYVHYEERLIEVATHSHFGEQYTPEQRFTTLIHEMLHAAIEEVEPAFNKEYFVKRLADRMSEAFRTAKF